MLLGKIISQLRPSNTGNPSYEENESRVSMFVWGRDYECLYYKQEI